MLHQLPSLPYAVDALAPYISKETVEFHWGKHHQTYVDNLNKLIVGTKFAEMNLEEIVKSSEGVIFNNAAQIWNHTFYWNSLTPPAGKVPVGPLAEAIKQSFGNFDSFKEKFTNTALGTFGSGWVWLVKNKTNAALEVISTQNAQTPLTVSSIIPLFTCDVWEHAYYIDYRNARAKYLSAFWNIINYDFAMTSFVNE
ncbi:MAG: superoxide dismutase [Oligoflexia bacterium]|nr:superoxide dismutase [Oligoflexia bacterium]